MVIVGCQIIYIIHLEIPIYEYIGRVKHIEPRQDYVINVDMISNAK